MATHFTSSSYRLGSQVKLSTAKKIHPETGGWFLEAYSFSHDEFCAKVTNSFANGMNSIAKATNSISKPVWRKDKKRCMDTVCYNDYIMCNS